MNQAIAEFGVRNDKPRGILIETVKGVTDEIYFFQYHDQPLERHCIQIQSVIRSANVKRSRKIRVDVTKFQHEYQHPVNKTFRFKGTKYISSLQQYVNSSNITINKEVGQIKR